MQNYPKDETKIFINENVNINITNVGIIFVRIYASNAIESRKEVDNDISIISIIKNCF